MSRIARVLAAIAVLGVGVVTAPPASAREPFPGEGRVVSGTVDSNPIAASVEIEVTCQKGLSAGAIVELTQGGSSTNDSRFFSCTGTPQRLLVPKSTFGFHRNAGAPNWKPGYKADVQLFLSSLGKHDPWTGPIKSIVLKSGA